MKIRAFLAAFACCVLAAADARAQGYSLLGANLRNQVNAVLGVMGFMTIPDSTVSSLEIDSGQDKSTQLNMGQLGLGFTVDPSFPLYLEGFLGYARYDPRYVASNGTDERRFGARWNNLSGTIGIGWDFPLTDTLVFRPIFNASLGYVVSDAGVASFLLQQHFNRDLQFLDGGHMLAGGIGGSVMLDYTLARPAYEIDVELRYTQLRLTALDSSSRAVQGEADPASLNLWARVRWPTPWGVWGRPLCWVVDGTHTQYLGPQRGALGFDWLTKVGAGIELDVAKDEIGPSWFQLQRVRVMGRYLFGDNVSGWSVGLGISF